MDYSVIFAGRIHEEYSLKQVRQNLAALFRTNDVALLDLLFSGKPAVLKKGLSEQEARKYQDTLLRAGAICELRQAGQAPQREPTQAQAPVVAAAPVPASPPAFVLEDPVLPVMEAPAEVPAAPPPAYTSLSGINLGVLHDELAEPAAAPAPVAAPPAPPPGPVRRELGASLAGLTLAPIESRHGEEPPPDYVPRPLAATTGKVALAPAEGEEDADSGDMKHASVVIKGNGSGYAGMSIVPEEVEGLCWGGFFAPWLWATFNGFYFSATVVFAVKILRYVMPYWGIYLLLNIPVGLFLLFKGRQFAWQNKSWASAERFNVIQRRWAVGGFVFFLLITSAVFNRYQRDQQLARDEAAQMKIDEASAAAEAPQDAPPQDNAVPVVSAGDDSAPHEHLSVAREAYLSSFKDPVERERRRKLLDAAEARDAAQAASNGSGDTSTGISQ